MSNDERKPDHTDAGEGRDVGSGGYPEEQPDGADPGPKRHEGGDAGEAAPGTSGDRDSNPAAATGNPDAAGG